jgi:uncharacterized coiled-coil protein SlyX
MFNLNTLSFDMLPTSYYTKPSVYVISDSQLAEYKRKQALAEITELNKLIASHQQAIDRLKESRSLMEQQFSDDKQATE